MGLGPQMCFSNELTADAGAANPGNPLGVILFHLFWVALGTYI